MVLRTQEIDKNFFTPRDYQLELVDKACANNIIVPLGTGSGKTFIAVLLIKEFAHQIIPSFKDGGKRTFFLVNTVALVEQQAAHIASQTNLQIGKFHGNMNVDLWDECRWNKEFTENQVIVMTAQIFLNLITHGYIKIEDTNLLIFDECHHALGKSHPYRVIMQRFNDVPSDRRPRVLGLTASVINNKTQPQKLESLLIELEQALHCRIETASDLVSLSKYGAKPKIYYVPCADYDIARDELGCKVLGWLDSLLKFSRACHQFNPEFDIDPRKPVVEALDRTKAVLAQLGPWCAWKVCQIWEKQLKKLSKQPTLGIKQRNFINMGDTYIRCARRMLEPRVRGVKSLDEVRSLVPDRVWKLLEILRAFNPDEQRKAGRMDDFCGIIFVEQRYVSYIMKVLLKAICKWDEAAFGYLKVDFVIGYSGSYIVSDETMALHRRQEEVLRRFRQKHLNLLVATSVLEEGVDVRQCNVVIRFDRPKEYRSFVQSKGRARKDGSYYFMLVEESDKECFSNDIKDFYQIGQILLKRYHSEHNPPAETIDVGMVDNLVPPYEVEKKDKSLFGGNARVTMSTAIALINRYCAKLPSDIFTRLVPQCTIIPVQIGDVIKYTAELILPINSPVKEVIKMNIPMDRKKYAQMAVALEACKLLHQRGELNDNLLPVGKDTIAKLLTQLDDDPDEWVPNLRIKVGSAKRKQLYDKRMAKALSGALPAIGEQSYIYIIDMVLTKPASKEANPKNRKIVDPQCSERCFGFLSKKKLPLIPSFPVFLRQGQVETTIRLAPSTIEIDAEQMDLIRNFHVYVFSAVLRLDKFGMEFNPEKAPVNILLIPLRKVKADTADVHFHLDYTYVRDVVKIGREMPRRPTDEQRPEYRFDASRFVDAIVMPWYRNVDTPHFYYVAELCHHLNPSAPFPDDQFPSFNEYFKGKWNLDIYDQTQPLLDVDYTSSRLNLLMPRYYNRNGKVLKSALDRAATAATTTATASVVDSNQRQILVPELVDVHPIPASLWNMIVALPSVLYRVNSLLLADELRQTVMREAFKCTTDLDPPDDGTFVWPTLNYGWPANDIYADGYEREQNKTYQLANETTYSADLKYDEQSLCRSDAEHDRSSDFTIGVWNPELGDPILGRKDAWEPPTKKSHVDDEETVGLLPTALDDPSLMSDDFDDDEDEILFKLDFKNTVKERLHQENQDPFAPRNDIVPMGWGEAPDEQQQLVNDTPDGHLLQLVSVDSLVDTKALQKDVETQIFAHPTALVWPELASAVGDDQKNGNVSSLHANNKPLYLDTLDMLDDCDRRRTSEDLVDLSNFTSETEPTDDICNSQAIAHLSELKLASHTDDALSVCRDAISSVMTADLIDFDYMEDTAMVMNTQSNDDDARRSMPIMPHLAVSEDTQIVGDNVLVPELDWMQFSFEKDTLPDNPYGVSPCLLLQALTMSNASDGINLERLETVGDSFLKYAVTIYLYNQFKDMHEGKLSFGRSKEVSNCNLYRLGKKRLIPHLMIAAKFDPQDSWLPPSYVPTNDFKAPNSTDAEEDDRRMDAVLDGKEMADSQVKLPTGWDEADANSEVRKISDGVETINLLNASKGGWEAGDDYTPLPYNLLTQQNISDKAIADSVEALIGAHLLTFGPKGALKFMHWLGLRVLPDNADEFPPPDNPLLYFVENPEQQLNELWYRFQFDKLETTLGYRFRRRAYAIQAFTHASYYLNRITGCYQRLEFLGDAVLDYIITRFLYEHKNQYSPGVLTDLRSALVNNTIFASLAVKYGFHKFFLARCPGLFTMIEKFCHLCAEKKLTSANFNEELYMVTEEEIDEGEEEDIEVPKAMGDMFESVAGAIFLDSGCSLDTVWRVFYHLMEDTIRECCANPPKSPIRELLEMEPERARFAKLERIIETGKVRVTVDVQNKCRFTGMGRSYRIAKCTAAKRALRYLKSLQVEKAKDDLAAVAKIKACS